MSRNCCALSTTPTPVLAPEAASELAMAGSDAQPALTALRASLTDNEPLVCVYAASALLRTRLDVPQAVEALGKLCGNPATDIRRAAAQLLGEGDSKEAAVVVPVLAQCLGDKDDRVRRAALESLGQFGPASVVRRFFPR